MKNSGYEVFLWIGSGWEVIESPRQKEWEEAVKEWEEFEKKREKELDEIERQIKDCQRRVFEKWNQRR